VQKFILSIHNLIIQQTVTMKFTTAFFALASVASAAAKTIKGNKAQSKVLKAARRVEEADEGEYAYLAQYTLKLIGCKTGQTVINPESGEYEYNAVVFRLCPTESGCDNDKTSGCAAGYGDFVVGLNTYVDAYFEDQADNMQWDDQFQVDEYAACKEYEVEDNGDQDEYATQYYIGPTCADDGADVKLAVFEDEACTYVSETAFETISNGWTLPYSTGGIVSTQCADCYYMNENGEYGIREMCETVYSQAAASCETEMGSYSQYGQNVQGCEYITELMPLKSSGSSAGKVFGWIVFVCVIGGAVGYTMWWRKSKSRVVEEPMKEDRKEQPKANQRGFRAFWHRLFSRST
jgi:hypothetical protein